MKKSMTRSLLLKYLGFRESMLGLEMYLDRKNWKYSRVYLRYDEFYNEESDTVDCSLIFFNNSKHTIYENPTKGMLRKLVSFYLSKKF